jgi:TrmH family RNA methyltransferase
LDYITSTQNSFIKELSCLHKKNERNKQGLFLIEGEKMISEALSSGIAVTAVLFDEKKIISPSFIKDLENAGIKIIQTTEIVISKLCDTITPQGIVGVCEIPKHLAEPLTPKGKCIILDNISNPGNLGTIIRTAESMGIDRVIVCGGVDLYNPKIVRSTMGSIFRQKIFLCENGKNAVKYARSYGYKVYAAALNKNSRSLTDTPLTPPVAVVIGNEGNGVSKECIDACDGSIIIPMQGKTQSLNAGIAAGIIIWEMSKL